MTDCPLSHRERGELCKRVQCFLSRQSRTTGIRLAVSVCLLPITPSYVQPTSHNLFPPSITSLSRAASNGQGGSPPAADDGNQDTLSWSTKAQGGAAAAAINHDTAAVKIQIAATTAVSIRALAAAPVAVVAAAAAAAAGPASDPSPQKSAQESPQTEPMLIDNDYDSLEDYGDSKAQEATAKIRTATQKWTKDEVRMPLSVFGYIE